MSLAQQIATELNIHSRQVEATIKLLDEGASVPFIARYRKEATGALDDTQLRELTQRLGYLRELEQRRQTILQSIAEQGKLTDPLRASIEQADTKVRLEDLYLPFKPKRRTKAQIAREAGLEPLAQALLAGTANEPVTAAKAFINTAADINTPTDALEGARMILLELFGEQADLVAQLRRWLWQHGVLQVRVIKSKANEYSKFRDYYSHDEPLRQAPSHRALAVFRGQAEGELRVKVTLADRDTDQPYQLISKAMRLPTGRDASALWLSETARQCWDKKLHKQLETELLKQLRDSAEAEAIKVFARNLTDLLLAAPAGQKVTMGLDPGLRTGVKVAVVDATGKLIDHTTLFPHAPQKRWDEALNTLAKLAQRHHVELISIGNGTASRETKQLVNELKKRHPQLTLTSLVVSEAGASVYSASALAAAEFPDLDVAFRGAVSIARRLQDPLAELVKIEPKAIGVGQYQHDVDQKALGDSLAFVVEDCVNHVGVDLNTASVELLTQIAGLNATTAKNIVAFRDEHGRFAERRQLLKVPRLGNKAFEQCAAFLRIAGGTQPLDNSAVHPESYPLVDQMAASLKLSSSEIIGDLAQIQRLSAEQFMSNFGSYTVRDVIAELEKPGRDPRPEFRTATFQEGIETINDLHEGMQLEGVVTNVTNFGAFVDIGVHQDGLVHISQLADRFIKDPHDVVKAGDIVNVRVVEVDQPRRRIALSMKAEAAGGSVSAPPRPAPKQTEPRQQTSLAAGLKAAGFKLK